MQGTDGICCSCPDQLFGWYTAQLLEDQNVSRHRWSWGHSRSVFQALKKRQWGITKNLCKWDTVKMSSCQSLPSTCSVPHGMSYSKQKKKKGGGGGWRLRVARPVQPSLASALYANGHLPLPCSFGADLYALQTQATPGK